MNKKIGLILRLFEDKETKLKKLTRKFYPKYSMAEIEPLVDLEPITGFDMFAFNSPGEIQKTWSDYMNATSPSKNKLKKSGRSKILDNSVATVFKIDTFEACRAFSGEGRWCITNMDYWHTYVDQDENQFYFVLIKDPESFMDDDKLFLFMITSLYQISGEDVVDAFKNDRDGAGAGGDLDSYLEYTVQKTSGKSWAIQVRQERSFTTIYDEYDNAYGSSEFYNYFLKKIGLDKNKLVGKNE